MINSSQTRGLLDAGGSVLRSSAPISPFQNKFQSLKDAVYAKRPFLKRIIEKYGKSSLYEYSKTFYEGGDKVSTGRKEELITTLETDVKETLGEDVALSVKDQLNKFYQVSTADHHGPICHPFFLSSNFLAGIVPGEGKKENLNNIIVLACSTVSLENSSFPRGILFNSVYTKEVQKLPFFSTHIRPSMVSHLRAYGREEMEKVLNSIHSKVCSNSITEDEEKFLKNLLEEVYLSEEILKLPSFSAQVTKTNFKLWQKYFSKNKYKDNSVNKPFPNLIYLELEKIAVRLLLDHHINTQTIIQRLIFDPSRREMLSKFEGLTGAFDRKNNYGTFLFWGVPSGTRYRLQMWNEGNALVSSDGSYRVELTPEAIGNALRNKEIIPSLLLDFLILTCYYGLKCQGGFSQINYLSEIRNVYLSLVSELGLSEEVKIAKTVKTDEMCGDFLVALGRRESGELFPATGIDWLMKADVNSWAVFVDQCKELSLEETLNPMMSEFYKILYGEKDWSSKYGDLMTETITQNTGLNKKLKPCIQI